MNHWIWVLIPLAAIFAGVIKQWLSIKERQIDMLRSEKVEEEQRHSALTQRLEARVRVLERIATDKGIDLAEEIDRLKDLPPPRA